MYISISFEDEETYSQQATARNIRRSMASLRLLMAMLFILLAVLLAVWVAGPEGRVPAVLDGVMALGRSSAAEAPVPAAGWTEPGATNAQVENQFPNPESWYEDTSPYAHEPLAISSGGGGMNLPK